MCERKKNKVERERPMRETEKGKERVGKRARDEETE